MFFVCLSAGRQLGQAAPLDSPSEERIANLYDLADAAYDAKEIRETSARLGHVALIDHNPRRGEKIAFSPAEARRYNERSSVERVNSHLHEEHGGRHAKELNPAVFVRSADYYCPITRD